MKGVSPVLYALALHLEIIEGDEDICHLDAAIIDGIFVVLLYEMIAHTTACKIKSGRERHDIGDVH